MCNGTKTFFDEKNKRTENQWNSKNSTYQGPDFIENGFTFKGVPIEYVFDEKVLEEAIILQFYKQDIV